VAWKGERRERVGREDPDFEHLCAGRGAPSVDQPSAVRDDHHARRAALGDVKHAEQVSHVHRNANLFKALARRSVDGILVVIDESTW
jgi:hypothetical protein